MIAAVENAILARLKAAGDAGALGYKYATLDSYPADWDAYFKEKTVRAPGAWVVFAGFSHGENIGFGGLRVAARFGVVVMAENLRNETATRHGGPAGGEPGSYQLMEDAVTLLHGQDLGLSIDSLKVEACHFVRTQEIIRERKVSMLALELSTAMSLQSTEIGGAAGTWPGTAPIGDFAHFHVDWDVTPFGGIDASPAPGIQLPDPDHADAADDVQLETRA